MAAACNIVTSLLLIPLKQSFMNVTSFGLRNGFILDPFCSNALIILVLFFQIFGSYNLWDQIPDTRQFLSPPPPPPPHPPFIMCHITLVCPSTLKTFLLFVTVAMLSRYQSAVNCSSRSAEEIFKHKVNYSYCFHFPGLEFMQLPGTLSPQGWGDSKILKIAYFLEHYIGNYEWQCRLIWGRCSYVLLSSAEKHCLTGN